MSRTIILAGPLQRERAHAAIDSAHDGMVVTIKEPTRNLEQNAAQWPILDAFSKQLSWPVNGHMEKLTAEEFKSILTAAFNDETVRLAMGLNGGVVMLGHSTSRMSKAKFSEWLDFLNAVAVERGVNVG